MNALTSGRGNRWRGGRTCCPHGYVAVWMPEHPNASKKGYVYEHVLVASRALGRGLRGSEVVHHVNGVKHDNRPRNLVVCPDQPYHMLLHQRQRALDACGHAGWTRCRFCDRWGPPETMWVRPNKGGMAHHRECHRGHQRSQRALLTPSERAVINAKRRAKEARR